MKLNTIFTLILSLFVGFGTMACGEDSDDAGTSETAATTAASGGDNTGGAAPADQTARNDGIATAGEEASVQSDSETAAEETEAWGAVCLEDSDCAAPTSLCVINPTSGSSEGYCSILCPNAGADCTYGDWTCNVVGGCESPLATWCGPPEEVEQGGGVVTACE